MDQFGNYSGMIGVIQRDEADCGAHMVRSDSMPFEPVRVGPPLLPSDIAIISMTADANETVVDVLNVVDGVDQLTYRLAAVVATLVVIWFVGLRHRLSRWTSSRLLGTVWPQTVLILCQMFQLVVDQEDLRLKSNRRRILWHHCVLFGYVAVFGYFLSLMSTDLVVSYPPPIIDSIDDHLSQHFNHVEPFVMKDMDYFLLMQQAPRATPIGRLYAQAMTNKDHNIYSVNVGNPTKTMGDLFRSIHQFQQGHRTILLQDMFAQKVGKLYVCLWTAMHSPDAEPSCNRFHIARETFGHGLLGAFWSKRLKGPIRAYLEYRYRTALEMGGAIRASRAGAELSADAYGYKLGWNVLKCELDTSEEETEPYLRLITLRKTFNMYFAVAGLATLCLIIELVTKSFVNRTKLVQPSIKELPKLVQLPSVDG